MPKFEYMTEYIGYTSADRLHYLNRYGSNGWELVAITGDCNGIFKSQIVEAEAKTDVAEGMYPEDARLYNVTP